MGRRISMEILEESYLDFLPRGRRNEYIRTRIDEHISRIAGNLNSLLEVFSEGQVVLFVNEASVPTAQFYTTNLSTKEFWVRGAIMSLWHEQRQTGLEPAELIEALQSGRSV